MGHCHWIGLDWIVLQFCTRFRKHHYHIPCIFLALLYESTVRFLVFPSGDGSTRHLLKRKMLTCIKIVFFFSDLKKKSVSVTIPFSYMIRIKDMINKT